MKIEFMFEESYLMTWEFGFILMEFDLWIINY